MPIRNTDIENDARIFPSKLDMYQQYVVMKPSVSATWFVNVADISGGDVASATIANARADYPRNVLLTLVDASGSNLNCVATVIGKDFFGQTISETLTVTGPALTAAGSKIFSSVTSVALDVTNNAASDTASLGYVVTNAMSAKIGLPTVLGAYTDIKAVTWVDNGTVKMEAIASGDVDMSYFAYQPNQDLAAADDYLIIYKSSKEKPGMAPIAGL